MSVERFDLRAIAPQPWKNGAGLTREVAFGGASNVDFDWRISIAEVERDAPFSPFPGIDRCIVLLRGTGMRLCSSDGTIDHPLTQPLVPFRFPGETALDATLLDGPSSDFNVMTRRGTFRSELSLHHAATDASGGDVTLLLCYAGAWVVEAEGQHKLGPMQALLGRAPLDSIALRPASAGEPAAALLVRLCHDRAA